MVGGGGGRDCGCHGDVGPAERGRWAGLRIRGGRSDMGAGGADRLRGGRGGRGGRRALHGAGRDESAGDAGAEAAGGDTTHGADRYGTGDGERPSRGESGGVPDDIDGGTVGRRKNRGLVDRGAAAVGWARCSAAQRHWCLNGGRGAGDSGVAAGRVPGRRRPLVPGPGGPDLADGGRIAGGGHLCRTHHPGLDDGRSDGRHRPAGAGGQLTTFRTNY